MVTQKIATALMSGLQKQGIQVECTPIEDVQIATLPENEFLAIGGPTHGFGISRSMKAFLKKLKQVDLRNKKAFAFDTKFASRFSGSAAKGIEKQLKKLGLNIVKTYTSAIVTGSEGPLQEGMEEKFLKLGSELPIQE
jgi:flavorubredoxin